MAITFGELNQQIEATRKLLMFDQQMTNKGRTFDADTTKNVRNSLFFALVKTQRYAEALGIYDEIRKEDEKAALGLDEIVLKIANLREGDGAAVINVNIGSRGYTMEQLLKKSVMVSNIEGDINALKFRCDRRFQELPFQAESEYRIPDSWGNCAVEVVGEPGTLATLTQL